MQFNEANPLAASRLGVAAREGDETQVKILLRQGHRVDIGDNRGWTPLHEAAAVNKFSCLQQLLLRGRRYVNCRTMEGETALLLACKFQGNHELVSLLLKHGADVDLGNNENSTPLHLACSKGKLGVAKILVEGGAKLNPVNFNEFTALHFAVSSGNGNVVKYLINKGSDVNIQDECGRTPLFLASEMDNWDVVEPLINSDQCVVDRRAMDGATALMVAAQCGNLKIVQELLRKGADPNLAADDHTMAIHLAVHSGNASVVELLLRVTNRNEILRHCKTEFHNNHNGSLCGLAVDGKCLVVLMTLVRSDLGSSILHLPAVVDIIIPKDHPNHELVYKKCSPVGYLILNKMDEPCENIFGYLTLLLKHDFPVNVTEKNSMPPLVAAVVNCAESHIVSRCIDILIANGADKEYTTNDAGVPDALLAACLSGCCAGVLHLLRSGSTGSPDDLLKRLLKCCAVQPTYMHTEMVHLLYGLGITDLNIHKEILTYFSRGRNKSSHEEQIQEIVALAQIRVCSLQQLCRAKLRQYHGQSLVRNLEKSQVPQCIIKYLTYNYGV